jgi:formate hydrogenlyase subunit 3/multisubunit Na+/H+ antiporter MnhD subunit
MPPATLLLLLPPALLVLAAVLGWCLRSVAPDAGRPAAAAGSWLALVALVAAWFAGGRAAQDLTAAFRVAGAPLVLRLDALTVYLWLVVLAPVALLLTFQRRSGVQAALAALAAASALATLAAGSVVMTAFGVATSAGLVLVMLRQEELTATRMYWAALTGAWLLLAWTAVLLQATGGTSAYGAVPVTALHVPILVLLAGAAVLCSGLLPWRGWVSDVWSRQRLEAGTLAVAVLVPVGFSPLVRAYGLGAGQLPSQQLNVALTALGALVALGAAVRAQAAPSRRAFLAEAVPLGGGVVLLSLGLGTPLGMVAGLVGLAGLGAAAGLAPLSADGRGPLVAAAVAVLVGVPPAVVFGGWLLAVQAAVEAGPAAGFAGLVAGAAWVVAIAAAARWARLPATAPGTEPAPSPRGVAAGLAVALAAGVGLTALLALLAIPAAAEVMPPTGRLARPAVSAADILGAGTLSVSTASGGWASPLLGGPLVFIGLAGAVILRAVRRRTAGVRDPHDTAGSPPEPLFRVPFAGVSGRAVERVRSLRFPEQYRSLFRPSQLQRAGAGPPWFWVLVTAALAFAVTR